MEQVLFGGYYDKPFPGSTEYNSLVGGHQWHAAEVNHYKLVSTDGLIKNLRVKLTAAPGDGKKWTFTLMLNGAPTALTFDIADAATSGSDMVHEIDVTGGDYVSLRCVPTEPSGVETRATWTCVFKSDTAKESLILGGLGNNVLNNTDTVYGQVMGAASTPTITENFYRQVVPTAGTIKNLYVKLSAAPGGGGAYRFTLRKGGASQTLTVTITDPATTGNDVANSFAVAAGDVLTMMIEPIDSPTVEPKAAWGMTFLADTDGESIVLGGSGDLDNAATEYNNLTGYEFIAWSVDETLRYQLGQVCTLKKLYLLLSAAPGVGNKYNFTLRVAGGDGNVTVEVAHPATTGNSGALEDAIALDNYVDLKVVPTDTPDAADAYWGLVGYIEPPAPPVVEKKHTFRLDPKPRTRMEFHPNLKLG